MQLIRQHAHDLPFFSKANDSQDAHFGYIIHLWYPRGNVAKSLVRVIREFHGDPLLAVYDVKLAVIGDRGSGKSALISRYCMNGKEFNEICLSSAHYYAKKRRIDEITANLTI